jgi:hypothetical protein
MGESHTAAAPIPPPSAVLPASLARARVEQRFRPEKDTPYPAKPTVKSKAEPPASAAKQARPEPAATVRPAAEPSGDEVFLDQRF